MNSNNEALFKRGRILYIFEALIEYLISILMTGSFLATVTKSLNFSDSLTGVISSVIALGCTFQLLSVLLKPERSKKFVIVMSVANQLLFMMLYIIPLTALPDGVKTALFIVSILSAYLIYNMAHPRKMSWLMSLVEDKKRGSFTANKEIVSLIGGMAFSYAMGAVMDRFSAREHVTDSFPIMAFVVGALLLIHTLMMANIFEPAENGPQKRSVRQSIAAVMRNKKILKVTTVYVIYNISHYVSVPFYGTYMIGELGLDLKTVALAALVSSVSRIAVSKAWGKYADKRSFAVMIEKCFAFLAVSAVCVMFATPSNGLIMFVLYYLFHGIAMGGINSAMVNMVFDYAPFEMRSDALAISQAAAGIAGFVTTVCISPLVTRMQNGGNSIWGVTVYAQQVLSAISLVLTVAAMIYVRKVLIKKGKLKE